MTEAGELNGHRRVQCHCFAECQCMAKCHSMAKCHCMAEANVDAFATFALATYAPTYYPNQLSKKKKESVTNHSAFGSMHLSDRHTYTAFINSTIASYKCLTQE